MTIKRNLARLMAGTALAGLAAGSAAASAASRLLVAFASSEETQSSRPAHTARMPSSAEGLSG